ncbi:hypothetical protein CWB72_11950 [Pseudoalteromonas phenolica]|nr:hypothetical protein CWB72_11950 [Pseudoalteromonas phenolica]
MYQGRAMKYFKLSCVILGFLIFVGLFVPSLVNCPPLNQNDEAELDIEMLQTAISVYYKKNNRLPENLGNLIDGSIIYIQRLPKDPWVIDYQYSIVSADSFLLWSKGSILNSDALVLSAYKYEGNSFIKVVIDKSGFGT